MGMMEYTPTSIAPLLLRNLVTSIFIYADKSLLNLAQKYKPLELIRYILITSSLFFLRLLPSLFPSFNSNSEENNHNFSFKSHKNNVYELSCGSGDSGIARALSQLLSIVNDIPINSRKYEVVRSLAERLIDENYRENVEALHEVNRTVLTSAFARALSQLEAAVVELGGDLVSSWPVQYRFNRVMRVVQLRVGWGKEEVNRSGRSAEKQAAELLWLAQKMAAYGFAEEAVERWASASNLGWLALSAEPRLQGSLVRVSAFLFKQAKDLGVETSDEEEEYKKEQQRKTKMKMLLSWLPLLCRASNGMDVPVLSTNERAELEKVLEQNIEMLEQEEEQEQVLSLWLHHFTYCPYSDWPNLHASYARWYNASRNQLLLQ
ncbi:uncharacterized protein LOC116140036 [Pistacia vera]|uniref:uncharacterized protein LOC116140036 n=1 Tax=Pistacia vera TaxID=55513 RepID=UPI001263DB93|nr:uncharacterized protein LOC116140036 [Pistacia vera]